ncbi:MAG: putative cysteine desulfurase [Chlamydiales bacterium]|jgi:cysteine desulfurase/selenocysteine lyase|nr:putative cysteine desulfurase [Chlamydiales bacterium]
MSRAFDVEAIRKDFPALSQMIQGHPLVYLDSAATTQKPKQVIDTITQFYQQSYGTVHRAVYSLAAEATARYHSVREKARCFFNAAKQEEIIFTKGTTEAINLVARSFGDAFFKQGDEMILTEIEHHANLVPWQRICQEKGVKIRYIPVNEQGELDLACFRNLLNEKTKLVSLAHVSNSLGTVHPIESIIQDAHAVGAKVFIDGAQSAAHLPVDVQALDVDFYACSSHKMFGPTGVGLLYGKAELLDAMPPYQSGGDMIDTVTLESTTFHKLPFKFEAGTPAIAEVIGLGAAIDYISNIGLATINTAEDQLLQYGTKQLEQIDKVRIIGMAPHKGAIISFVVEGVHHLDIGTLLDLKGIAIRTGHHCSQPTMKRFGITGTCRISFALYNTTQEIDVFVQSLQDVIRNLS